MCFTYILYTKINRMYYCIFKDSKKIKQLEIMYENTIYICIS